MKTMLITFVLIFCGVTSLSFGQQDTTWSRWNWLIGEWVGEGSGTPGQGGGWFSFQPDLDKKILVRKSHSEYPATTNKPKIIHDDLLIVYPDSAGQPGKAIYFDNESHIINYAITYAEKTIILTSGKVQNTPFFRLTYVSLDSETIDVKFEISFDGKTFKTYIEGKSKKKN
jgi:hypothetical protein